MNIPNLFTQETIFSKLLSAFILILLPFFGFYLGTIYQSSTSVILPCITVTPIKDVIISKPSLIVGEQVYQSTDNGYSVTIPKGWIAKIENNNNITSDFLISSSDVALPVFGEGGPVKGAQIRISVNNSKYETLADLITEVKSVNNQTNKNIKLMTISGFNAIQYQWSWEGDGISTVFIKDEKMYQFTLYLNPANQKSNSKYLVDYNKILQSLSIKTLK